MKEMMAWVKWDLNDKQQRYFIIQVSFDTYLSHSKLSLRTPDIFYKTKNETCTTYVHTVKVVCVVLVVSSSLYGCLNCSYESEDSSASSHSDV